MSKEQSKSNKNAASKALPSSAGYRPFLVTGDHPTLARPDKAFANNEVAQSYFLELVNAGYENPTITYRTR